jgi:hypothetical protein
MKTIVTGPPVAEKSFFTASLLRILAILLIVALSILSSCTNTADKADKGTTKTKPATTDYAYQYNEPESTTPTDLEEAIPIKDFAVLTPLAKPGTKVFKVDTKKDTVVVGNKGVMLHIPANSFDLPNPNAEVKIEMKEYTSKADFFFSGLTTASNGQLLESGGTVYISATADGKEVKLKEGSKIELAFPNAKPKPDMQTFYGEKTADGTVNWLPTGNSTVVPFKYTTPYVKKVVIKKGERQTPSTLSTKTYQIQVLGAHGTCTRFEDTTEYKNILEYLDKNFTISAADAKLLKGSYLSYEVRIWYGGKIRDIKPVMVMLPKAGADKERAQKAAAKRVRNIFVTLLNNAKGLQSSRSLGRGCYSGGRSYELAKEIIRIYINDIELCDGDDAIKIGTLEPYEYKSLETVYDSKIADSLRNSDARYSFLKSEKLGWINCDRFYGDQIAKTNVHIGVKPQMGTEVTVIFKDIMSVIHASPLSNKEGYGISNIPAGANVKYVAIQNREDGLYFAVMDSNTSQANVTGFEFKPMTVEAVKKELATL